MTFKQIFPDRPRLDVAVRWLLGISVAVLAVAAVLERDPRQSAAVVAIASYGARETLVLPEQVARALGVVTTVAIVAWLALLVL